MYIQIVNLIQQQPEAVSISYCKENLFRYSWCTLLLGCKSHAYVVLQIPEVCGNRCMGIAVWSTRAWYIHVAPLCCNHTNSHRSTGRCSLTSRAPPTKLVFTVTVDGESVIGRDHECVVRSCLTYHVVLGCGCLGNVC